MAEHPADHAEAQHLAMEILKQKEVIAVFWRDDRMASGVTSQFWCHPSVTPDDLRKIGRELVDTVACSLKEELARRRLREPFLAGGFAVREKPFWEEESAIEDGLPKIVQSVPHYELEEEMSLQARMDQAVREPLPGDDP